MASRDEAVAALQQIAQQGEATAGATELPSHFARFVEVYEGVQKAVLKEGWHPYRPAAINPYVPFEHAGSDSSATEPTAERSAITDPEAQHWAHLFNIRYRLLLQFLLHSFELEGALGHAGVRTPRGVVIHTFRS